VQLLLKRSAGHASCSLRCSYLENPSQPGTRGIAYNAADREVLLAAGQTMEVTSVRKIRRGGQTITFVEVILQPGSAG